MRIKIFNTPKLSFCGWVEFGAGMSVVGGLLFSFVPF